MAGADTDPWLAVPRSAPTGANGLLLPAVWGEKDTVLSFRF